MRALANGSIFIFAQGSDREAGGYAKAWKKEWVTTPGALEHLRKAVARQKK